jgi:hypothetical protein
VIYTFFSDACFFAADVAAALHYGRLGIEAAERSGSHLLQMTARGSLGAAHTLNGEWDEARRLLEEARSIAGEFRLVCWSLAPLVDVYLGLGDDARAHATADEAVAMGRQIGSPYFEYQGQIARARVVLRTEGSTGREAAETALARAAALAEQMEARLFEPHILTLRAELAQTCGDADGRVRALREAHRLCVAMGLDMRAKQIHAELGAAPRQTERE